MYPTAAAVGGRLMMRCRRLGIKSLVATASAPTRFITASRRSTLGSTLYSIPVTPSTTRANSRSAAQ